MAKSKWKQVKVKVKGQMVTRWTDGKTFRLKKPTNLESGLRQAATSGLKKGDYNVGRTKQWDGTKYVPVNVVHAGQKATRNGKPVVADGKGNWRTPAPNSISGYGAKVGTYKSGNRTSGTTTSTTVPKGSMNISAAGRKQAEANKAELRAKKRQAEAAAKAAADKKAAAAKAAADRKARLAKQNSNAPSRSPSKKSAASTFRDKRDTKGLKIGRAFTLKEHQDLVNERKRKKSAAEKAGYPGQRNY